MKASASILVVDDDATQAQEIAEALEAAGYKVRTALGGDEALAALLSDPPALAIVDCHLPDRSGPSVMKLASGTGGNVPFVVISGKPELPACSEGLASALTFLRKPLDLKALTDVVSSLVTPVCDSAA
jgi:DNA-binding NtrC family response regulator